MSRLRQHLSLEHSRSLDAFLFGCWIGVIALFAATLLAIANPGGWEAWRVAVASVGFVPVCGLGGLIIEWLP